MGPKYPKSKAWSPYAAGALAGLLLALSVLVAGSYFGASTTFVRSAGLIEQVVSPGHVDSLEYFAKEVPKIDWQFMFVIGIFLGSLVSSLSSGTFRVQAVPDAWRERFGANPATRAVVAFCGGVIAMFGARLAGGCPSGHGLSGLAQMALSGYVALICFFIGGVFVARILYRGR